MTDQAPRPVAARRGFSVSYKGKTLLSAVDPVAQGERVARAVPKRERTLYFCPSPLYGYGLDLLAEGLPAESAALCVEADPALFALSAEAIPERVGVGLIGTADPAAVCGYVRRRWGPRRFRRVEVVRLSGGWQLFPAEYDACADALRRDFAVDWGNALTLTKLGRRYMLNGVRNMPLLAGARPLGSLHFGDTPVLVLGAGPSLDEIAALLPAGDRRFRVVCVDTALPALKARGVTPDLAVVLESQHWNMRDFIGLGDWDVPTAMDFSALPATARVLGGRPLLFATLWTDLRLFRRLGSAGLLPELIPPLGSVGLTAVAVALKVSAGMVIVGGLDFSYTLDGFHARGAPSRRETLARQTRLRSLLNGEVAFQPGSAPAVAKSGKPVRTNPALKTYRDLFEQTFGGVSRIRDIIGPGLPLGVASLSPEEALRFLQSGSGSGRPGASAENASRPAPTPRASAENIAPRPAEPEAVAAFMRRERAMLAELRDMLTGSAPADSAALETLLDEADYLWAHFPDCAAAGGRRPSGADLSFLKRVRAELDPLIKVFDLTLQTLIPGIDKPGA